MGRIILANRVHVFLSVDEEWSIRKLVPLFDPSNNQDLAIKAWNAYAYGGKWNERILGSLFSKLIMILPFTKNMNKDTEHSIYQLSASILFYSTEFREQLLGHFFTNGDSHQFTSLTNVISPVLEQLEESASGKAWKDWLHKYVKHRLDNIPIESSDAELAAIVTWLPALEPVIEEFVNLLITGRAVKLDNSHVIYTIGKKDLGKKYPMALLLYFEYLLKENGVEFYTDEIFEVMMQILESLQSKHELFPKVCEYLLRSNGARTMDLLEQYTRKF
ncbi:hypothetical protein SD71_09700 [Cohnella kolymensis]|uniref:DUF4020 domain-containing protein n=1 Tax=Cohnella kolymensis TaxID=1590652 RepID=A0ABR5A575_9BACL|nr:DUF4020 domain-containing protein [Cohnella kolymensis]KIL36211.1 hypothetical protein SD71_09700 [Cohnella kolymensis]